jgi:glycosyltransferase involved in cell wall biosynthesis
MKIALLSRWYWEENRRSGDEGGTTRQLAEAVAQFGHEVVVLSQSHDTAKLKKAAVGAIETWLSPREKRRDLLTGFKDRKAKKLYGHRKLHTDALALDEFLKRRGPFDVLWAQTEAPDGLVAAYAAHLGIPVPPTLVQMQALRYRFDKGAPVFTEKRALSLALAHATRIVANSEMVAGALKNYCSSAMSEDQLADKARVVHPNLLRAFIKVAGAAEGAIQPMADRILFLGALNIGKGALVFMNAIPRTELSKRSSVFVVVGDFTEDNARFEKHWEETKEAVRVKTLGARIEYLGHVSTFEVIRQIQLASVVVVPSLFDAFSRVVVEALALGRPVITTERVGAAQLVLNNGCGIVVPPNDPDALARSIDGISVPGVPFALNAGKVAPRLLHDFAPDAIAEHIVYNLLRAAGQL